MYPDNLRYTKDHEWVKVSGEEATVGVTFFAQKELGDVVYVELPEVGRKVKAGEEFGTIESVKAVSELYAPVSGEVVAVNEALADNPEIVNEDSYDRGWMIRIKTENPAEAESLLDAPAYQELIGSSGS